MSNLNFHIDYLCLWQIILRKNFNFFRNFPLQPSHGTNRSKFCVFFWGYVMISPAHATTTTWCTQFSSTPNEKCTRQTNSRRKQRKFACLPIPPLPIRSGLGLKVFFGRGFVCEANFECDDEGGRRGDVGWKAEMCLCAKRKGKCIGLILR